MSTTYLTSCPQSVFYDTSLPCRLLGSDRRPGRPGGIQNADSELCRSPTISRRSSYSPASPMVLQNDIAALIGFACEAVLWGTPANSLCAAL